ncbi:hypothetical protein G5714_024718 [Onychostoma macrolepis]|uniref:Uncharacterized protein n=1 Tax=Onychostoma macrolepis TaxID=369639 RepID=A0A7J6BI78_9TELE|nr:hypothetical protein G5714_024718 [Onychostoma macrolepis]
MNCTVDKEEVLRYKTANKRKQNRHRKKARQEYTSSSTETEMESSASLTDARLAGMDEEKIYHPVKCTECSTEVAVRGGATIPGVSGPCDLPRRRGGATIPRSFRSLRGRVLPSPGVSGLCDLPRPGWAWPFLASSPLRHSVIASRPFG